MTARASGHAESTQSRSHAMLDNAELGPPAGHIGDGAAAGGAAEEESPAGHAREEAPGGTGASETAAEAARLICLRLLASRPRTRAELASALRRRRVPDEIADQVLARFAEVRLIDDAAFARAWVESRHHGRGLARRALAAELKQRGVAPGAVRAAISSLGPDEELATARRLVATRVLATRGWPLPTRVRRLVGLLARKGYPAGVAYRVVREALQDEQRAGPDADLDLAELSLTAVDEDAADEDWPAQT